MFGKLENLAFSVEKEKLEVIKKHIRTFYPCEANEMMINRLQQALDSNQKISGADACFYFHELREAELMENGYPYAKAHIQAIQDYNVSPFSLYHPDVISALPDEFNLNWQNFWGLNRDAKY